MPDLLDAWPAAVGPAIARNAWPARIARDGTVHVNTADSIWAFELGHQAGEIAARLGVERLRFAPGPLPEPDEERTPEPLEPTPDEERRARELAAAIGPEKLRESVQKAVRLSLARERRDRPV
jgi:hypothetical protein